MRIALGKWRPVRALVLAALLVSCLAVPAAALVQPGQMVPSLNLPDTQGGEYDLAQLSQGKVTLIVYWSVTCPHCREELPQIKAMADRLAGQPFGVVLVNADGQAMAPASEAYIREHGFPGPYLLDLGPNDTMPLGEAWNIVATPGVFVADPQGKLIYSSELQTDVQKLEEVIRGAIK